MRHSKLRAACLAATFAAVWMALAGCSAGSGEGLDENGRPIDEGGGDVPLTADFDSIQANVFTKSCALSGCHVGAAAPFGLKLDEGNSYALLVDILSGQAPATLRVKPFDPDGSYLIQKLEGTGGGSRMPLGGPSLPQATIDVIRQWITEGALPGSGGTMPAAPTVVATNPSDSAILNQLPANITVTFSENMDASLISNVTIQLVRSGNDGSFGDGNEVTVTPTSLALSPTNARLLTIDLAGSASVPDDYQLRLAGTPPTALASVQGEILDGDGDGNAGGDFTSTFSVTDNPDVTAPTVSLAPIPSPASGTIALNANASDDTGVVQVTFLVAGAPVGSTNTAPYTIDWNTATVADGDHDVTAEATDAAGNKGTSAAVTVTTNNAAGPVTYTADVQPIFQAKCNFCHTTAGFGGHNIASNYDDAFLPADNGSCTGLNIGRCTIIRIQEGDMPQGADCDGDPANDTDNPACLTQAEQDIVQAWIDGGLPE